VEFDNMADFFCFQTKPSLRPPIGGVQLENIKILYKPFFIKKIIIFSDFLFKTSLSLQ
jgi:hypothetical protein